MLKLLYPKLYVESLTAIRPEMLSAMGIRGVLLDLDNTLVVRGGKEAEPQVLQWLECCRQQGFKLCIVSNNLWGKGGKLARTMGLPGVFAAAKPRRTPFHKGLVLMGTEARETAVVGDQLFTDVLGGNRMGLYTILVSSLGGPDFILTQLIIRRVEKLVLARLGVRKTFEG